ncbi:Abi family protein [Nocardia brevicatena]|uniref:Abi family protein n=1 Tax=Nocardia brevicatena TaxID=37327 RepID=UPI0014615A6E|nr:Abi family protein [Nocardia brevicatena]
MGEHTPSGSRRGRSVTSYEKPFKTLSEQVGLLRGRGMVVDDEAAAVRVLSRIGYYRLSGYWYIFRALEPNPEGTGKVVGDTFIPGTTFERVVGIYEFDRRLRLHILDAIERVEVALRVQLGYTLGAGHAFAHLDPALLDHKFTEFDEQNPIVGRAHWLESPHGQWLRNVRRLEDRSKEDFVKHFRAKYGMPLPVWVVTELLGFGSLATLLAGLKPQHKNIIAASFGVYDGNCDGDGAALTKWIANLASLRNACAHHLRVWNRNMVEQVGRLDRFPDLAHATGTHSRSRVYASLAILAYLTGRLDPQSRWRIDTAELIASGLAAVAQPAGRIGCPPGWEEQPLWSRSYVPPPDPLPAEHREILQRLECVGASEAGAVIDPSPTPRRRTSAVRYHRLRSELLGLPVGRSFRFPNFQLDTAGNRIDPIAREVNRKLGAKDDPWRVAAWWTTPNAGLRGAVPVDLLLVGELTWAAAVQAITA